MNFLEGYGSVLSSWSLAVFSVFPKLLCSQLDIFLETNRNQVSKLDSRKLAPKATRKEDRLRSLPGLGFMCFWLIFFVNLRSWGCQEPQT